MDKIKNFKIFTNANKLFDGLKVAINVSEVDCIYEDTLDGPNTRLWSPNNEWSVKEDFDTVMKIINE